MSVISSLVIECNGNQIAAPSTATVQTKKRKKFGFELKPTTLMITYREIPYPP